MNITRLSRREVLAGALLAPGLAERAWAAQPFWAAKPANQWTGEEVARLFADSPWAKDVRVEYKAATRGGYAGGAGRDVGAPVEVSRQTTVVEEIGTPTNLPIPGGAAGVGGAQSRTNIPGGQMADALGGLKGPDGTPLAAASAVVRWENAPPLLEAMHTPIPETFADRYAISITGVPALTGRAFQPGDEDMMERLGAAARLEAKGRSGIQAGAVHRTPQAMWFGFSRELLPLTSADRDVRFTFNTEQLRVQARFDLKGMVYRGVLAV